MASPTAKRQQQSEANQSKDFAWTVPLDSGARPGESFISTDEKAKISAVNFPAELKFNVPVDLEGSKYAFKTVKEGMTSNSDLAKNFADMKQLNPQQVVDPLGLDDATITKIMS